MKIPLLLTLSAGLFVGVMAEPRQAPPFVPIDPQRVQDQETMTWQDYRPIPGTNWADNRVPGGRVLRVALVAVDFPDQPFVITPKQSDLFGNPQVDPVTHALHVTRGTGPATLTVTATSESDPLKKVVVTSKLPTR